MNTSMIENQRFCAILIGACCLHMIVLCGIDFVPLTATDRHNTSSPQPTSTDQIASTQPSKALQIQLTLHQPKHPKSINSTSGFVSKRTISAATHRREDESYLAQWQSDLEVFGNAHYPEVALQQNLQGDLRLLVSINADGSLRHIEIRQSSGHTILDKAAINIVKQAAPFEPLPPEVLGDHQVLEIIRTWQFRGELLTSRT